MTNKAVFLSRPIMRHDLQFQPYIGDFALCHVSDRKEKKNRSFMQSDSSNRNQPLARTFLNNLNHEIRFR